MCRSWRRLGGTAGDHSARDSCSSFTLDGQQQIWPPPSGGFAAEFVQRMAAMTARAPGPLWADPAKAAVPNSNAKHSAWATTTKTPTVRKRIGGTRKSVNAFSNNTEVDNSFRSPSLMLSASGKWRAMK
jgi:hypothetical protein